VRLDKELAMKRTACLIVLVLASACRDSQSPQNTATPAATSSTPRTSSAAAQNSPPTADAARQQIVLVGCLRGTPPAPAAATGTPDAGTTADRSPSLAGPVMLVNASPVNAGTAGVGTQGAGASGGPLVAAKASYELDALPANARDAVNKQVEVTGHLDTASAVSTAQTPATPNTDTAVRPPAGSMRAEETAGRGSGSTSAPRSDPAEPSGVRRVAVETVKVIADTCALD
jgi:hypothetical protein